MLIIFFCEGLISDGVSDSSWKLSSEETENDVCTALTIKHWLTFTDVFNELLGELGRSGGEDSLQSLVYGVLRLWSEELYDGVLDVLIRSGSSFIL